MKKDVIISIKHQVAEKIYAGEKTVEFRKRKPKIEIGTRCWIYESKPIGKITGYFMYFGLYRSAPSRLWRILDILKEKTGITHSEYMAFSKNTKMISALVVRQPCRCHPIDLHDVGITQAPKSYMFFDAEFFT